MRFLLAACLALSASFTVAAADEIKIEKLKLVIDFPGTLEIFDTDVMGKQKLPPTEVRIKTSIDDIGTVHIEQKKAHSTAEDAIKLIKITASDASNVVVAKLPEKGWVLTWRYNEDKWRGAKVFKKIKGKWFLMDARPESDAALQTIVAAFKSVRAG